jgi:hypothetical protein
MPGSTPLSDCCGHDHVKSHWRLTKPFTCRDS